MSRRFSHHAVAIILFATAFSLLSAESKLEWKNNRVEARGFPAETLQALQSTNWSLQQWQQVLSVRAHQSADLFKEIDFPAMSGTYQIVSNRLEFVPIFPLEPNVSYEAVLHAVDSSGKVGDVIESRRYTAIAEAPKPTAVVSAIYPSAAVLPENLLKFYIHFSAPMSGGHIYDHIQLLDAAGKPVELPFLEIDEELWNPTMTRLTLFLDPGRIKRGVRPLEEIGPSFQAGKTYTLTISKDWRDAEGAPLKSSFEKKFSVTSADRVTPDPKKWKLTAPKANQVGPVELNFEKPLDQAILKRTLTVVDESGKPLVGTVEIGNEEQTWRFIPDHAWKPGSYRAVIPTLIEDIAGNNVGKAFDVDLNEGAQQLTMDFVKIPFEVK